MSICVALAFAGFARAADEGETPSEEPANREILVESGEELVLNALDMTNGVVVRAMAGSTLKVAKSGDFFPTEPQPGFTAFHGVDFPADADWPAVGTSEAEALARFKYDGFTGVVQDPERVKIYQKAEGRREGRQAGSPGGPPRRLVSPHPLRGMCAWHVLQVSDQADFMF